MHELSEWKATARAQIRPKFRSVQSLSSMRSIVCSPELSDLDTVDTTGGESFSTPQKVTSAEAVRMSHVAMSNTLKYIAGLLHRQTQMLADRED